MPTLVSCPSCRQSLQVPDEFLGKAVQCSGCDHTFAAIADRPVAAPPGSGPTPLSGPPPLPPDDPPEAPEEDEDDFAAPLDEKKEKKPRKPKREKGKAGTGYYGELIRRQKKMQTPHRGVLILTLGILSLICSPAFLLAIGTCICGIQAYQMGSHDINEMESGRMDPSGRTMSHIGRILGVIGAVLSLPVILLSICGLLGALVQVILGRPGG